MLRSCHTHSRGSAALLSSLKRANGNISHSPNQLSLKVRVAGTPLPSQTKSYQLTSRRYFFGNSNNGEGNKLSFLETAKLQAEINQLEKQLETSSRDIRLVHQYLRALGRLRPKEAVAYIERGWQNQSLPMTEELLKEYLKSAASLNKLDGLNVSGLLAMANKAQGGVLGGAAAAGGAGAGTIDVAAFLRSAGAGAGGRLGGGTYSAGASPLEPLYIAQTGELTWKQQAWKLAKHAIALFLLFSLVGTFLDEKAPGGGIASKIGVGSAVHQAENPDKTFQDVVGVEEAKHDLQEIVMYLKDPKKFTRLGGRLPKGVLLTGPPGTGKTLLARAIAGEAKVPFYHASGSEFEEMYVGVGAKRVRELFEVAKQKSPCIIFIDEIDAIGGSRQVKDQSAMKMTLNQLLVEMDGFEQNNGVIVIAATNFPDSLDNALIRPGRFDKHVDVPMPDIGGRKAILGYYAKKVCVCISILKLYHSLFVISLDTNG